MFKLIMGYPRLRPILYPCGKQHHYVCRYTQILYVYCHRICLISFRDTNLYKIIMRPPAVLQVLYLFVAI